MRRIHRLHQDTHVQTARKYAYQRAVYSVQKRVHCLVFQSLATSERLIFSLNGPTEVGLLDLPLIYQGRGSDIWPDWLYIEDVWYYIYGDLAYLPRTWIERSFTRGICFSQEEAFNLEMSEVCTALEHSWKDQKQLWTSQNFALQIIVRKAVVMLLCKMLALQTIFRVFLYGGGQIIAYFEYQPPTLEEYHMT